MLKTKQLSTLIARMTKSERRNFKILASKTGVGTKKYVHLFDWIDKYGDQFEGKANTGISHIVAKYPSIKKAQLPNLKNNLYKQILSSLRDAHKDIYTEIKAREQFDFAKILYAKGLYLASLEALQKAKELALKIKKYPLVYLAIDFEKEIESQHFTGSMSKKAIVLAEDSRKLLLDLSLTNELSNLSLLLYARYLRNGFIKDETEAKLLQKDFKEHLPKNLDSLSFNQRLHLYQAHVWYNYMSQNFTLNYRYALKWLQLFDEYPTMIGVETYSYVKALHNVLSSLFILGHQEKFNDYLDRLQNLIDSNKIRLTNSENAQIRLFLFTHKINKIILFAEYKEGLPVIEELVNILNEDKHGWDVSRLMVFHYKIACIYFGNEDYDNAIYWLNRVINENYGRLKEDVQCFARILSLITHFEMKNDLLVSYQVVSVYRFLLKMKDLGKVQREIFNALKRASKLEQKQMNTEFLLLKNKLLEIYKNKYERRPFLYLDVISWLDSKLDNTTMLEAIRKNMYTD